MQALEPVTVLGRRRVLLTASAWALVDKVSRMAISLVSVPLTLGYLGNERYGLWMTALSVNAFIAFIDAGLTPVLKNRMAEAHAKGDRARFAHYAAGGLAVGLVLLIVGFLVVVAAAQFDWSEFLHVTDPTARAEAKPLLAVMLCFGVAQLALAGVDSIFIARLMLSKPSMWAFATNFVNFAFLLLGVHYRVSLPILAALIASQGLIYKIPLLTELIVREPQLFRPRWSELPPLLRELVPSSLFFMGIEASFVAINSLPNVLIARMLTLSDVATFSVATRVMSIPLLVIAAVLPIFWPAFTAAWVRGERPWLRSRLAHILLGTAVAIVTFDVGIAMFGKGFIAWWTGGRTSAERLLLCVMGGWLLIQSLVHWLSTFLHSITDFRFELICFVASALLLLLMGILFLEQLGLAGLALAMTLSLLIGSLLPMGLRVRRKLASRDDST